MLRDLIISTCSSAIAEELNEQALEEVGCNASTPQLLATELGRTHLFCEPNRSERQSLGILDENQIRLSNFPATLDETTVARLVTENFRLREEEWLRRLRSVSFQHAVFICGADHIKTFAPLALKHGFNLKVEHENWQA